MFRSFKFFIFLLRLNFLSGWLDERFHDGTNHSAFAHVAFLSFNGLSRGCFVKYDLFAFLSSCL